MQGIPFAAIELCETWTDLYTSLFPGGTPKSGIVSGGLLNEIPAGKLSPDFAWLPECSDQRLSTSRASPRSLPQRSSLPLVGNLATPTLMLQGRRDFVFDNTQAIQAFNRRRAPSSSTSAIMGTHLRPSRPPTPTTR